MHFFETVFIVDLYNLKLLFLDISCPPLDLPFPLSLYKKNKDSLLSKTYEKA